MPAPVTVRPAIDVEPDLALDLIEQEQQDPSRACIYVGTERPGIAAELDDLDVDWRDTLRVAVTEGGRVIGAVLADWDLEVGRSWIHGPWVDGSSDEEPWLPLARDLLDAAVSVVPPEISAHEISADVAHEQMAALAAERGWQPTEVNHVFVADAAASRAWPGDDHRVRDPRPEDAEAIAPLHDQEFPATYYSLDRILSGAVTGEFLVAVAEDPGFLGYAVGRVQADGEGYLDYLAVTDDARGRGVGTALLATLGRRIIAAAPRATVNLTVQDHRGPAVALYERLGFRRECSMVGYRSPGSG